MPIFKLQFRVTQIRELASRYASHQDEAALKAGQCIAGGDFCRKNLEEVFEWKTGGRGRSRLRDNSDEEIADALRLAVEAKTPRAAVAVLTGLHGVAVPVASAILTVIDPACYTIIDWRALEALGISAPNPSTEFYLAYLAKCRKIVDKNPGHCDNLRQLDRAMWQWSKEATPSRTSSVGR